MAADIHDTLAQSFSSIAILAQAARQNGSVRPGLIDQIEVAASDGLDRPGCGGGLDPTERIETCPHRVSTL
ncbi:histidine kinase dimerization/phosphoacceptor domain-containing protein [Brevibacterium sp. SMBL_HHYL_HB1]|nr:histidine kinase dimerization/phosphoacceptor domain-containing protein [Brevibacterium sp. SMBL_HHYL_HB1]